jgi:hypothetical protein
MGKPDFDPILETMTRHHFRSATEQSMNAKVSARTPAKAGKVLGVVAAAAALLVGTASAFAESHGGGGGGAHFSGGGGHFSGGGHVSAPHFAGGGGHYAPHGFSSGGHAQVRVGGARGIGRGYGGYGYGLHGGFGYGYHPGWGGGYWRGAFWPAAYYGWSYPLYLGFLPALYATYWWGGVPYYYVNNVYYNWNPADNNYVAVDPPPASAAGYSDDVNAAAAAGPDAGNAVDNTPPDVAPGSVGPGPAAAGNGIIAYPRNGQSEQQQATDKFQCHTWAKGQTGFDPTNQSSSGANLSLRTAYGRAMSACLDARGYTVR